MCSIAQSCLILCDLMDYRLPGFPVHEFFQARILEQVAISYSWGSSWPRGQTQVSCVSCIGRRILYHCAIWEAQYSICSNYKILAVLPMEKAMAPHSSTLAWKIPWTEEPDRLQSMGSLRVRHDWATSLSLFTCMHWRRKWQPTPVFLPGESQGRGSLVGCRLRDRTELDTTEAT